MLQGYTLPEPLTERKAGLDTTEQLVACLVYGGRALGPETPGIRDQVWHENPLFVSLPELTPLLWRHTGVEAWERQQRAWGVSTVAIESRTWHGGSRWSAGQDLGVQEFDRLFVNFHILSERDG
jgi:hypothetical protein